MHLIEREQYLAQVEKLVASRALHGSESLCKLLRYLAKHAIDHPGVPPKEYQVATEVFARPPNFDPLVDSTVRVQAGRLRLKLAEYYSSEGVEDPTVVELPKGAYALTFHHRGSMPPRIHAVSHDTDVAGALPVRASSGWVVALTIVCVLLAGSLAASGFLLFSRKGASGIDSQQVPPAFRVFWRAFTAGPEEPWVVFSNAKFLGRPETGMRYYDRARDGQQNTLEHYTGVGEVLAVHELDHLFSQLQRRIRLKRGSLFTLDDAKNNNLIFIGSPSENLTLLDMPGTREFVFERPASGPRRGDLAIANVHPQPDEPKFFFPTPPDVPLAEDYAVVALIRGLNPSQAVLILAGTTTIGTQAAAEYVCRQSSVEQLLLRLAVSDTGDVKPFEAVLRVKVIRGVPVETQLVALRKAGI